MMPATSSMATMVLITALALAKICSSKPRLRCSLYLPSAETARNTMTEKIRISVLAFLSFLRIARFIRFLVLMKDGQQHENRHGGNDEYGNDQGHFIREQEFSFWIFLQRQQHHILRKAEHGSRINGTVGVQHMVISPYVAVRVYQHEHIGMNEIGVCGAAILGHHFQFVDRKIVYLLLVAGKQGPFLRVDLEQVVPFFQLHHAVAVRVNAERKELDKVRFAVA